MFDLRRRQDQKTVVRDQPAEVGSSSLLGPSNILISGFQRPRGRTEDQGPKISMFQTLHHISDLGATQRSASKIVVSIKERKPNLGFLRISTADRINSDFAQLTQRTTEFRNIRLSGIDPRALKPIASLPPRQIQNTTLIQFGQCLPATHLLEPAVWRPPIQPLANPPRQIALRNRWLCSDSLLHPIQNGSGKMSTANIHEPLIPSSTPGVKCVLRSAFRGRASPAPRRVQDKALNHAGYRARP